MAVEDILFLSIAGKFTCMQAILDSNKSIILPSFLLVSFSPVRKSDETAENRRVACPASAGKLLRLLIAARHLKMAFHLVQEYIQECGSPGLLRLFASFISLLCNSFPLLRSFLHHNVHESM
jgi:hypothetical protein